MTIDFDIYALDTPYFAVDERKLTQNLELLRAVSEEAGCKILLAQKAFSMFSLYPLIGRYLAGATSSGLYEARLAHEHMSGEKHVFSPAYREREFGELCSYCGHIVFNSLAQYARFAPRALEAGRSVGLRVNPERSTQERAIYDPCAPGSRLGIKSADLAGGLPDGVEGLHFHTLCEQNSDALALTLEAFEARFSRFFPSVKWVNFGGGHHITRADYDVGLLVRQIRDFRGRYGLEVYLEPGEAVALNAGYLVAEVVDIVNSDIAILDASAACHMPDVLEAPYRPEIVGAGLPGEKKYTYKLGGPTCLAGDIVGDYSFDHALAAGERLVFLDMAHYSMVKTNTFNGMALPTIAAVGADGVPRTVKRFCYEDFSGRLS